MVKDLWSFLVTTGKLSEVRRCSELESNASRTLLVMKVIHFNWQV